MECVKSSTLHVLQGSREDPGLVSMLYFPRLVKRPMRWLAIYVALSRVRRLKNLRSLIRSTSFSVDMRRRQPWTLMPPWQLWGSLSGAEEPAVSIVYRRQWGTSSMMDRHSG